jgi:hypothetical protein
MASRGATQPYREYEAEDAITDGVLIGPSRVFGDMAGEASARRAVRLDRLGQSVQFRVAQPANSIVVRFAIPDAPAGGGTTATLGLYVDGVRKVSVPLTSRYSWTYGDADAQGAASDVPSNGTAHHFYDEVHTLLDQIEAGATVALRRDDQDTAAFYVIDLVDLEQVPPPLQRPANALAITDFGATADDASDDGPAIRSAIAAARTQHKGLWVPPGTFRSSSVPFEVSNLTIRGAGMWHSVIQGPWAQFKVSGSDNRFHDFAVFGETIFRDDQSNDVGFDGPAGTGSRLENVWIEHEKVGWWVGKGAFAGPVTAPLTDGLVIHGARIRNTFADGIKLVNGTRNSVVEQSSFRNTGDDAIGTWSFAGDGPLPCENDSFRFNTVQTVWRASCLAAYGGKDIHFEDNVCADTSNYPGLLIATSAGSLPFGGTLTAERNTLVRAGGPHYGQEIGALRIFADQLPISGVQVLTMLIEEPTFSGIQFAGAQPSTAIVLRAIEVKNPGTVGISITSEAQGAAQADNVTVEGVPPSQGLRNDATAAFSLQRGTGNTGW